MFNVNGFVNDITFAKDDEEVERAGHLVDLIELVCDDPWLTRQAFFGMAGAMERQLEYLGTTLLPNAERRLNVLEGNGILSQGDVGVTLFSNEDQPHINEDRAHDQIVEDQKNFIDSLLTRMRTAGIIYAKSVVAHDGYSRDLDQLTYSGIKAQANKNKMARGQKVG